MITEADLNRASQTMLDQGERILQGVRFADTDAGHVARLLEVMAPPQGARIADMGSGFGEVARLMRAQRPDLSFALVNDNAFQLSKGPDEPALQPVLTDMTATGFPRNSFDAAMFLYSICHVDLEDALAEARKIVRPGGILFVFDYLRIDGDNALPQRHLGSGFHPFAEWWNVAMTTGWGDHVISLPDGDDALFRRMLANDSLYGDIFDVVVPMLWRAT